MGLSKQQINQAANDLFTAHINGQQIDILSMRYPEMGVEDAYAIQRILVNQKIFAGNETIGWKVASPSNSIQNMHNIDLLNSGILLSNMEFAHGSAVKYNQFIRPHIGVNIAFIMKTDLIGADINRDDVIAATQFVAPALEILDTRIICQDPITGTVPKVFDTIADNAGNAGIVLGQQRHAPDAFDLRWVGAILKCNEIVEETGLGAGMLDDPVESIVWLAKRLAQHDQHIKAGELVLSGSFTRPVEVLLASSFTCDFGDFGQVAIIFA